MKNLKYILILSCLWLTACTQDNDSLPQEAEKATVHLNLKGASIEVDTRSTTPQDPQTDNPMYSLWLLHYNHEGQLVETQFKDLDNPYLTYEWSPTLNVASGGEQGTLCLIANMNQTEAPQKWPERLADFKEAYATLQFNTSGLISERKMYMFGYYEGKLTSGQSIDIMLGRMAAALKFVITPKYPSSDRYKITNIKIEKASKNTYYFLGNLPAQAFTTFSEDFGDIIGKNASNSEITYYYQVGENVNPATDNRTKVIITAAKGTYSWRRWTYPTSKEYTVILGFDAPGTANRNYSLYRNNNYTFNIQLTN